MGESTTYLSDEDDGDGDGDFFSADDFDSSETTAEPEVRVKREPKPQHRHDARQRLDSRKEELWLKQQLNDWDDGFDDNNLAG